MGATKCIKFMKHSLEINLNCVFTLFEFALMVLYLNVILLKYKQRKIITVISPT